ncbi:hypothetical protein ACTNED_08895 [Absicoccus porci]|uniref:hypothetical protein n=1 Tax=Absicoccus porci TaxID=2486576 RepID=UPI003F8CCD9C
MENKKELNKLELVEELTNIKKSLEVIVIALKEYVNDELVSSIIDTLYLDIKKLSYVNDTVSRTLCNE